MVEIEAGGISLAEATMRTQEALAEGPDVVFQGALSSATWGGYSDFLERVETTFDLGPFSYRVSATKFKRKPDPKHVLQLVLYSDLLAEVQGTVPERAHLELGSGEQVTLRLADYASCARHARARLQTVRRLADQTPAEAYGAGPPADMMDKPDGLPTSPPAQQQQQDLIDGILAA